MIQSEQNGNSKNTFILWLLRLGLHALYTRFAWAYDAVSWMVSRGRWQAWGRAAIPFLQGPRVLELGHGPGHLLADLLDAGFDPVGIDLSSAMSAKTKRLLEKKKASSRLIRGRVQQLGFANNSFDSVVSVFPSEYILDDNTLKEIYRVLSHGGILVMAPVAQQVARPAKNQKPQYSPANLFKRLEAAGFKGDVRWVKLISSQVMVIVLQKIAQSGNQRYH
jgi:ubiquinone/menaquinone biosynthesis C-methylase UbiE